MGYTFLIIVVFRPISFPLKDGIHSHRVCEQSSQY